MANEIITVNGIDYVKSDYDQAQRLMQKARDGAVARKRLNAELGRNSDPEFLRESRRNNPYAAGGL